MWTHFRIPNLLVLYGLVFHSLKLLPCAHNHVMYLLLEKVLDFSGSFKYKNTFTKERKERQKGGGKNPEKAFKARLASYSIIECWGAGKQRDCCGGCLQCFSALKNLVMDFKCLSHTSQGPFPDCAIQISPW